MFKGKYIYKGQDNTKLPAVTKVECDGRMLYLPECVGANMVERLMFGVAYEEQLPCFILHGSNFDSRGTEFIKILVIGEYSWKSCPVHLVSTSDF